MSLLDWAVLALTLSGIIFYGWLKGRKQEGAKSYLLADRQMPWYMIALGVMATQASAVTFVSAPGQAYTDGMRFVQYYFGLPIAMVVVSITFIPIYHRLKVYTAYEYLEQRFDKKTRMLTAGLFLLSRGCATGISIFVPSLILSSVLGWNVYITNVLTGGLLMVYTYTGGAKAIAHTQKLQFTIILLAMAITGWLLVTKLPAGVHLGDALYLAGKAGKLNAVTTHFDWNDKYNIYSGLIGGFFLALSYFGADQSQVGRYLSAKHTHASRYGLLLNGLVKIPMQFLILLIGVLLFVFYSFKRPPISFNDSAYEQLRRSEPAFTARTDSAYRLLRNNYELQAESLAHNRRAGVSQAELQQFKDASSRMNALRDSVANHIAGHNYSPDKDDTNYIFLYFVKNNLPSGLIGLLFAVIFLASWGSISAALNSLTSSSLMDIHARLRTKPLDERQELVYGRLHTLLWGLLCIGIAMFAARLGSLIEAVNVLGSLFYGTILGIFLVAFYCKKVNAAQVFVAATITEAAVILIYCLHVVSFLWLNAIGALGVVALALAIRAMSKRR
jgi:solute:Na+ symporter, SSS family